MKKILFIDANDSLFLTKKIKTKKEFIFLPYVISSLKFLSDNGYFLYLNFLKEKYNEKDFNLLLFLLKNEGIKFELLILQKVNNYAELLPILAKISIDQENSFIIGKSVFAQDLSKILELPSLALKSKGLPTKKKLKFFPDWSKLSYYIPNRSRRIHYHRATKETEIKLMLNLDGSGKYKIDTGLEFFNHMIEQLSRHSGIDITLKVKGDLHIDEHHTVEDTAIALGLAFKNALGDKRGIGRYGYFLPMDECSVTCGIDFSGRPELVFKADFKREMVGDLPTEMVKHFFQSFAINAGLNLYLEVSSGNEHHMIESSFKALAKSLGQAVNRSGHDLPTTKGLLA